MTKHFLSCEIVPSILFIDLFRHTYMSPIHHVKTTRWNLSGKNCYSQNLNIGHTNNGQYFLEKHTRYVTLHRQRATIIQKVWSCPSSLVWVISLTHSPQSVHSSYFLNSLLRSAIHSQDEMFMSRQDICLLLSTN